MPEVPVHAGDVDGTGRVYDQSGALVARPGESCLGIAQGWDMNVRRPWRKVVPKIIFMGFNGKALSSLYVTTTRIVLIRQIDAWRELSGEMTVLGMPTAVAKEARLKELRAAGVREYCEIHQASLRLVSAKRFVKHGSRLDLRLIGCDGHEYAISYWKSDGKDDTTLALIESQFHK
jgi:hypothetical protein